MGPKAIVGDLVPVPIWDTEDYVTNGGFIDLPGPQGMVHTYVPSAREIGLVVEIVRVPAVQQGDSGGEVLSQDPASGTLVAPGSTVKVSISLPDPG